MRTTAGETSFLVLSSDGLYSNEERGGGGGLSNERVGELCAAAPKDATAAQLAKLAEEMAREAVEKGSTDDITVLIVRL